MSRIGVTTMAAAGMVAGVGAASTISLLRRMRPRHPKIRLTYLDIKGFAEPIRLALAIGDIPFEDRRIGYEEVAAMRAAGELPYGQVPLLEIDGEQGHGQSAALLRWAGLRAGLCPSHLQLAIDGAEQCMADIVKALIPAWYHNALPRSPVTGALFEPTALSESQLSGLLSALNGELLPARFAQLELQLTSGGGPFLAGAELTTADLLLYVMAGGIIDGSYCEGISPAVLDECPQLRALVARVAAHPKVAAWNARHDARVERS